MQTPRSSRTALLFLLALVALLAMWLLPAGQAAAQTPAPQAASAAPALAADATAVPEYKLGPGDVIRITVYQNQDLSMETRLSDGGVISYPLLGAVRLGGLSVGDAEKRLAQGLQQGDFVKSPQVTVVLMQARGSQVSVLGQVNRPGRFALELAGTRLSDVLALAGGVNTQLGGDTITVVGTRGGQPFRQQVDLPQVFSSADRHDDIVLQGNDVVYVERAPLVYIYGEVQRPGASRPAARHDPAARPGRRWWPDPARHRKRHPRAPPRRQRQNRSAATRQRRTPARRRRDLRPREPVLTAARTPPT